MNHSIKPREDQSRGLIPCLPETPHAGIPIAIMKVVRSQAELLPEYGKNQFK